MIQTVFTFNMLFSADSLQSESVHLLLPDIADSGIIKITLPPEMNLDVVPEEDIFDAQMGEAKTIFAEAIISDLTGDTL